MSSIDLKTQVKHPHQLNDQFLNPPTKTYIQIYAGRLGGPWFLCFYASLGTLVFSEALLLGIHHCVGFELVAL